MHRATLPDPASSGFNVSQRDRWKQYLALFGRVTETYQKVRALPALVCSEPDRDSTSRSLRWTPDSCHYAIDVEHAIKAAIGNRHSAEELARAWDNLLDNPDVIGSAERRLIELAGPIFKGRGLEPRDYFCHVQRGSANGRNREI